MKSKTSKRDFARHPLFFPFCYALMILGLALHSCSMRPNVAAIKKQLDPYPTPSLSSVSPMTLFTGGGATLTLTGTGFLTGAQVSVDGSPCIVFGKVSDTTLTCVVPSHASGSAAVQLTNPDSQMATLSSAVSYAIDGFSQMDLIAGNGSAPQGYSAGVGKSAHFYTPFGIVSDGNYYYVADSNNGIVRKVDPYSHQVTIVAGAISAGGGEVYDGTTAPVQGSNATYPLGVLQSPMGLALNGNILYISDYGSSCILTANLTTGLVSLFAGMCDNPGLTDVANTPTTAQFYYPDQITYGNNHLYIADEHLSVIRQINLSTGRVSTLAGDSTTTGTADGIGAAAQFLNPSGIWYQNATLYVVDAGNSLLRSIDPTSGLVTTLAGAAGSPYPYVDGNGTVATFSDPEYVTGDGTYLYLADSNNSAIRKIFPGATPASTIVSSVVGLADVAAGEVAGPLSSASLGLVFGVGYSPSFGILLTTPTTLFRIH